MEEIPEVLLLDIKEETEELIEYPLPEEIVSAKPLDVDTATTIDEQINQFCRLCLRARQTTLVPLMSRIKDVTLPDMIRSIAGFTVNLKKVNLPRKLCIDCVKKLDYAFSIQKEFAESDRVLKGLARSKVVSLVESLQHYQKGLVATSETYAEKLLREQRDSIRLRVIKRQESMEAVDEDLGESVKSSAKDSECGKSLESEMIKQQECLIDLKIEPSQSIEYLEETLEVEEPSFDESVVSDTEEISMSKKMTRANDPITAKSISKAKRSRLKRAQTEKRKYCRFPLEKQEIELDPNKCYICEYEATSTSDLEIHLGTHADMIPYDCQQCATEGAKKVTVKTLILLHRHLRMHAGSMKCPQCPFRACTAVRLRNHMRVSHGENANTEYTCEICGHKVLGEHLLRRHMSGHRAVETGRYQCSICEKKFSTKTRLTRHEQGHTNEKPFDCTICGQLMANRERLNMHMRKHTGERGHRCEVCGNGFTNSYSLQAHMAAVHDIGIKKENRLHQQPSSAAAAAPNVELIEPKKCDFQGCAFESTNRQQFYLHRAKHKLRHQCHHCDKAFSTRQQLTAHENYHTGHKPYCCELCGQAYHRKIQLTEHMNGAHKNVRPHSCDICGAAFVRKGTLRNHWMKHSETLQHQCRYCGKKFRYDCDRYKHQKTGCELRNATQETVTVLHEEVLDCSAIDQDGMEMIVEEYVVENE